MEEAVLKAKNKVVGLKQTLRAVQQDRVRTVYVANDVDEKILWKVKNAVRGKNIELITTRFGQREFGRLCGIDVGASVVALLGDRQEGGGNDADH